MPSFFRRLAFGCINASEPDFSGVRIVATITGESGIGKTLSGQGDVRVASSRCCGILSMITPAKATMRTNPKPGRFGLIPLLFICGSGGLGFLIAQWAFHHFGWIGGLSGFIGGAAIIPILAILLEKWERRWLREK
jgi:hypothetical protein